MVFPSIQKAAAFANLLSEQEGLTPVYSFQERGTAVTVVGWDPGADGYRLPTKAEWSRAAVGGRTDDWLGDAAGVFGWTAEAKVKGPQPVGLLEPNPLGLYDVVGNLSELVWDAALAPVPTPRAACLRKRRRLCFMMMGLPPLA